MIDYKKTYFGVVEDNNDPDRLNRCKIRVFSLFDGIDVEDIPWASPTEYSTVSYLPEVGKIVSVKFRDSIYMPEYKYSHHKNPTLEQKLKDMSDSDYTSFKSPLFDNKTQVYRNDTEGLVLDHLYSKLNIDDGGDIIAQLRDSNSYLMLGDEKASQSAILGNHFLDWLDTLVDHLIGQYGGPYLAAAPGSPVVGHPQLLAHLAQYKTFRQTKFLSDHVKIVDNLGVKTQNRTDIPQDGDDYTSTNNEPNLSKQTNVAYEPDDTNEVINGEGGGPPGEFGETISESDKTIDGNPVGEKAENGKLAVSDLSKSKWLSKDLEGDAAYLVKEAQVQFDKMIDAYNKASFEGKYDNIIFTDGYRSYERQVALKKKYGSQAATPGKSNHGWAIAVDMWWGVPTRFRKSSKRVSAFKHPVYRWFIENGPKYGWYNPPLLRDNISLEEWWHWEYHATNKKQHLYPVEYQGDFTDKDAENIVNVAGGFLNWRSRLWKPRTWT